MNRRLLLAFLVTLPCHRPVRAAPDRKAATERAARDAVVLEMVLLDLLDNPGSPVDRTGKRVSLRLAIPQVEVEPEGDFVLPRHDAKQWAKLSAAQLAQVGQGTRDLVHRLSAKDNLPGFHPKDQRISLDANTEEPPDQRGFFYSRVFRACPPGYADDRQLAVVYLCFPWSGGFHGGDCTYVLVKKGERWTILVKQFMRYF